MITGATADGQTNPFPGLRPFREDEDYLFFGRESQVDAMVNKLAATRFLAVVGTSGSGKSSLVNCGLLPALHRGLLAEAGTAWRMALLRPGNNPLQALAHALAQDGVLFRDYDAGGLTLEEIIDTTLRMSKLGLIDIFEQAQMVAGVNLLVVVDQFEELFRYRQIGASQQEYAYGVSEEAIAFVNLLLEIKEQAAFPIYAVLTMRSDFLGDCAQFPGLPEAINAGQYLVPRMTRNERRAAIRGPVGVGAAEIAPVLLTRLVNDVGDNPDQLSILQHALNRTWARWQHQGGSQGPLDLTHYDAIGTMAHALDQHAEKAYKELTSERQRQICAKIFKALTDKATDPRGVRRPTKLDTLCLLADATEEEVTQVIDVFRKPSRSFLMPPAAETLEKETVIDISHESLMRVWTRLKTWAQEEAQSAQTYRRLVETSELFQESRAGLWRKTDVDAALIWKNEENPSDAWAARFGGNLKLAMEFLEASRRESEREERETEEARQRELTEQRQRAEEQAQVASKFRSFTYALCFLFVFVIFLGTFAWFHMLSSKSLRAVQLAGDLADRADIVFDNNAELGLLLAIEAVSLAHRPLPLLFRMLPDFLVPDFLVKELSDRRAETIPVLKAHVRDFHVKLSGHTRDVTSIAFSPDGKVLASASDDNTVKLWDVQTGKEIWSLNKHLKPVKSIAFSPDGKLLATSSEDWSVILWDVSNLNDINILNRAKGLKASVRHIAFDPGGKRLAIASEDKTVKVWDFWNGDHLRNLEGHSKEVYIVRFSPTGEKLATAGEDETAYIWDADTGEKLYPLEGHEEGVRDLAFSPDETLLATVGMDKTFRLWDVKKGKEIYKKETEDELYVVAFRPKGKYAIVVGKEKNIFGIEVVGEAANIKLHDFKKHIDKGHTDQVFSVSISPNNKYFATASKDGTAKVWDISSKKSIRSLDNHRDEVYAVVFSGDGRFLATAGRDKTARIWSWTERYKPNLVEALSMEFFVFSPDGTRIATGSRSGSVKVWDVETGKESYSLPEELDGISSLNFSPDGTRIVTLNKRGTVKVWETETGKEMALIADQTDPISSVTFSPDGRRIASRSRKGTVKVWETETGKEMALIADQTDPISSVTFSPDGRRIASRSHKGTVKVWETETGKEMALIADQTNPISSVTFSPDGRRIASRSRKGTVKVWETETGKEMALIADQTDPISSVTFSPDGRRIASRSRKGTVKVWETETGKEMALIADQTNPISSVTFSPDGRRIASRSRKGTVKVWETETGKEMALIADQTDPISSVTFSPDGRRIASRSRKGTVKLWNTETGKQMLSIADQTDPISLIEFSPDGRRITTRSKSGAVKVWWVEDTERPKRLIKLAKQRVKRNFKPEECEQLPENIAACMILRQLYKARDLVKSSDTTKALAEFQEILEKAPERARTLRALELDTQLTSDEAASILTAAQLLKLAEQETQQDNFQETERLIKEAKDLVPKSLKEERGKIDKQHAKLLIKVVGPRISNLRRQNLKKDEINTYIKETAELLDQAYHLNKHLNEYSTLWNDLCWYGILNNEAETVKNACEKAVELDPGDGSAQDSLAVARALTLTSDPKKEDIEVVIKGFEDYMTWAEGKRSKTRIKRREKWINELRSDKNPFDKDHRKEALKKLRYE